MVYCLSVGQVVKGISRMHYTVSNIHHIVFNLTIILFDVHPGNDSTNVIQVKSKNNSKNDKEFNKIPFTGI